MRNFDMRRFYEKWLQDMRDDQSFNCRRQLPGNATCGALADVTPFDGVGGFPGAPPWQVAGIVVLRNHWREYADPAVVLDHYDSA